MDSIAPFSPEDRGKVLVVLFSFYFGMLLIGFGMAYLFARWLTGLSGRWALRHGIVSQVTHRSSHTIPTPRLGGIGLAFSFAIASFMYMIMVSFANWPQSMRLYWIGAGWLLILIVGLLDDIHDLPPLAKLGFCVIAVLIPALGGHVTFQVAAPLFDSLFLPPLMLTFFDVGLSALWLLFFVNAYNFMDGMDGFAAGFARLSAIFLFVISFRWFEAGVHIPSEFPLLFILAGACAGFLHWNNPPARIFMGDGGSLSVGYLLAIYVVLGCGDIDTKLNFDVYQHIHFTVSSLTILLPFIFDVILTLIRRSLRGENILKAHREHLYQRLMKTGLSHAEVLAINKRRFWIINIAALLGSLPDHPAARWAAFAFALLVMIQYWRLTLARERVAGIPAPVREA